MKTGVLILAALAGTAGAVSMGRRSPADLIQRIGFDQRLGAALPLDAALTDDHGRRVTLRGLLDGKPAVLAFVYYGCPMLCTLTLNGLVRALRVLSLRPGRDFSVIAVSINPWETPGLARQKRQTYLDVYRRPDTAAGWHFLVAKKASIDALTRAAGFKYVYDASANQYAHAPGLILLTADGRVSQYLPGIEFEAEAVRLSLIQASAGRLGGIVDHAVLLCYQYDPETGRYGFAIIKAMRILAALTVAALSGGIVWMLRGERGRS